jgi:hypothetical protein
VSQKAVCLAVVPLALFFVLGVKRSLCISSLSLLSLVIGIMLPHDELGAIVPWGAAV